MHIINLGTKWVFFNKLDHKKKKTENSRMFEIPSCFFIEYTDFDEILQALPQFFKGLGHEMDWNFVDIA